MDHFEFFLNIYCLSIYPLHAGSGTRAHPEKRQSRKAAKPPRNAQAAKPQSRHGTRKAAKPPWNAQAAKPQSRKLWSVKKRQRAAKRQGVEAPRSVKAAKLQEAPKRQEASKLQEAAQRRSVKEPPTKGWLCLEGDGLAYGKRSATKRCLCLEGDGLAYCETIRSEFRRTMADVMATPKRLKRSIRLNEWQFSFLFG